MIYNTICEDNARADFRPGTSILHVASIHNLLSVVAASLAQGLDPNAKNVRGEQALHYAAYEKASKMETLRPAGVVLAGTERVAKLLLEHGADPDLGDKNGETPLWIAASGGHEAMVELLLARRDVRLNSKFGVLTPLAEAANNGHAQVVKVFLKRDDLEVDWEDEYGGTTLFRTVRSGSGEATVRLLLQRKDVNVNSVDHSGHSPLSIASARGHERMVRLLLERNDLDVKQKVHGGTPLFWAIYNGHHAVAKTLQQRGAFSSRSKNADYSALLSSSSI